MAEAEAVQGANRLPPFPSEVKMLVDGDGSIVSVTADLAVVMLQKAFEEKLPELRLGEDEIQSDEVLMMAGYGHDEEWGGAMIVITETTRS